MRPQTSTITRKQAGLHLAMLASANPAQIVTWGVEGVLRNYNVSRAVAEQAVDWAKGQGE